MKNLGMCVCVCVCARLCVVWCVRVGEYWVCGWEGVGGVSHVNNAESSEDAIFKLISEICTPCRGKKNSNSPHRENYTPNIIPQVFLSVHPHVDQLWRKFHYNLFFSIIYYFYYTY